MPAYPYDVPVVNGGFETGDTTGWTDEQGTLEVHTVAVGVTPRTGSYFGAAGDGVFAQASQAIDLDPEVWDDIDDGKLNIVGSVWMAGTTEQDEGQLGIWCFDEDGRRIAHHINGAFFDPGTSWSERTAEGFLYPGTRSIKLYLNAARAEGTAINVYWEDVTVTLTEQTGPIKQVSTGLVYSDEFRNRNALSIEAPPWTVLSGANWATLDTFYPSHFSYLQDNPVAASEKVVYLDHDPVGVPFVVQSQMDAAVSGTHPGLYALADETLDNGYFLLHVGSGGLRGIYLFKVVAGVETQLDFEAYGSNHIGEQIEFILECEEGRQRVWLDGTLVLETFDTTFDAAEGWGGYRSDRSGSGTKRTRHDEFRVQKGENGITVTGLPTGYKARIMGPAIDGGTDIEWGPVTETAGTAFVPLSGAWCPMTSLAVLNPDDDVVANYTPGHFYRGDVYSYTEPASFPPLAPDLTLEGGVGWVQFTTTEFRPNPGDPTDTHQSTKYQLDDTDDTFGSLVVDEDLGSPNLLDFRAEGLAPGTYYGRVLHIGLLEDGEWSDTEIVVVTDENAGEKPTLTLVAKGQDFVEVEISAYQHDDGEVDGVANFDPDDPKPYLAVSRIQSELQADADWNDPLSSVEVAYDGTVGSRRVRFEGLTSGTPYKFRGSQLDGYLAVETEFSDDLDVTTDAAPGDAPAEPTITDIDCGRDITITGSAYSGVDAHSGTRVRLCYGSECQILNISSPVTVVTLTAMPPGTVTLELAYQDTEGEWSTYSDPEECEVPDYPPFPVFTNPAIGAVLSAGTTVTWEVDDPNAVGWHFDIQSSTNGDNWTSVATDQVTASTPFSLVGKANGTYFLRVRSRNPVTDETGEWSTLTIELDRTGVKAFHVHFADYESNAEMLADGWMQIGDGPEHLTFGLHDEYDPEDDATYRLGLFARNVHTGTSVRRAGFVNTRFGQPDEFDLTAAYEQIPNGCSWYPYRGANPQPTRGGLLARGIDLGSDLNGYFSLQSWGTAWYLGPNMQCVSESFRNQATAFTAKYENETGRTGQAYEYLRGMQPGRVYAITERAGTSVRQTVADGLTSTTDDRVGGGYLYFDEDNVLGRNRVLGTLRQSWRRAIVDGEVGWNVTTRVFAPGASLSASTRFVRERDTIGGSFPGGKLLACGYCGIAFEDMDRFGVGRSEGIIFTDFSLRVYDYGSCEAPTVLVGCQADWRLTGFKADDVTPQYGLYDGDYLTGHVLEGDYHDNRDCPRPYLLPHRDFSETSIDFPSSSSDLGQIRVGVVDKRITSDQNTGLLTALRDEFIGRRHLYERWREDLGYVTVFDGVCDNVELDQSMSAFWLTLRDPRERERETELFGRNETHALYPDDGPIEPYGVLPNDAGYLIAPVQPQNAAEWDGRLSDPGGDDGVHWGIAILSERSDVYKEDRLYPHGFSAFNSTTGKYEFRDITVRWRYSAGGVWHYLRNMPSVVPSPGTPVIGNAILPPAPGSGDQWRLYMASYDSAEIPTTPTFIDLQILAVKTSEETPFWWDRGTLGDLALEILAGQHSESPPAMRYSPEAMADWALHTPRARFKVTAPVKGIREWMERNIYGAYAHAPSFDEMMREIPVPWELPSADEELVELDGDWLIPVGEFSMATASVYNDVSYTYIQESLLPGFDFENYQRFIDSLPERDRDRIAAETRPEDFAPWERLLEDKVTRRYVLEASAELFGTKAIEYEPVTIRSTGTLGEALLTLIGGDTAQNISDRIGNDVLSRFGWGAAELSIGIRSGMAHGPGFDPYTLDLRVGQWVKVRASWLPNFITGTRSTYRYMQIKSLTDPEINYRRLRLIDGGPVVEESVTGESDDPDVLPFLEPPSFDYITETSDLRVEITVIFPPTPPTGYKARVDYAVSATEPSPSSGLWVPLGYLSSDGTLLTPVLPAGSTVWIRARGEVVGRRPSAWTPSEFVVLAESPALLSVELTLVPESGGLVQLEWDPNAFTGGVEIEVSTGAIGHTPTFGPFDEVDASSSPVNLLGEEIGYDEELIARVTAWETFSLGSVGGTEGQEYVLKVKRPAPSATATHEWGAHLDTDFIPPEARVDNMTGLWDTYTQKYHLGAVPSLPIDLTTDVTGVLPPDNGGTGLDVSDLSGMAGKIVAVNGSEDGFELVDDQTGGSGTIVDAAFVRNVSSFAFAVNTNWQDVNTSLDLTLTAQAGDLLIVGVSGQWSSGGQLAWLDVVTRVSGSAVNSIADNGSAPANGAGFGVDAWFGLNSVTSPCSGSVMYTLVSGDISSGTVTLRLRGRLNAASSAKTFTSHQMWAQVLRP